MMTTDKKRRSCTWIDRIIVVAAEAARRCETCEGFYLGRTCIAPERLVTECLNGERGLIRRWSGVRDAIDRISLPDSDELDRMQNTFLVLENSLNALAKRIGEDLPRADLLLVYDDLFICGIDGGDTADNRARLKKSIDDYLWILARIAYRLDVAEHRIWHEHGDWEIQRGRPAPYRLYDERKIYANVYLSLSEYDDQYPNAFDEMRTALDGLEELRDNLPMVFVTGEADTNRIQLFAREIRASLLLPTWIAFADPMPYDPDDYGSLAGVEPCGFLTEKRRVLINRLNAIFQERARRAGDTAVRRKWYEAAAELQTDFAWGQPVFTPEQADRIIALANAAQRESWIQRQMRLPENAALEPIPVVSARKSVKKGRKGSGRHGTKTEKMDDQLSEFRAYLAGKPLTKSLNVGYRASNWWRENQSDCEAAAKASGEKRGYADYRKLAGAYRSWVKSQTEKMARMRREKSRN